MEFYKRSKKDENLEDMVPKMKIDQVSFLYDQFLEEEEMDEMKSLINYLNENQLKELIDLCKVKN